MALDDIILEPLAKGYNKLPSPVKKGTSNFTSNISTLLLIPNNILQGSKATRPFCGKFYNKYRWNIRVLNPAEKLACRIKRMLVKL